jgi:hypothetical protein
MERYVMVEGYWEGEDPEEDSTGMLVDRGEWSGDYDDRSDEDVGYYLCGDPLKVGDNLGGFIVTSIDE